MRNREIGFIAGEKNKGVVVEKEEVKEEDNDVDVNVKKKPAISRREFLKVGAVGLATAVLMPKELLGRDRVNKQVPVELKENYDEKLGSLLKWNVEVEKPNEYQLKQIIEMKNRIVHKIKKENFSSMMEMLKFINSEVDSNFEDKEPTVYLKDAFAEKDGVDPKGSFDCDSRAIMCQSVLEELGYTSSDVEMCTFEGHMMLKDKKTDQYFETTENKIVELDQEEKVQENGIDSYEKYLSYLITNEAIQLALDGAGEFFGNKRDDRLKLNQATEKFNKALELDKDNITACLNYIKLIKDKLLVTKGDERTQLADKASEVYKNMMVTLVKKHYGISGGENKNKDDKKIELGDGIGTMVSLGNKANRSFSDENKSLDDLGLSARELAQGAIVNNKYIEKKFSEYAEFNYYQANNFEEAARIWESLVAASEQSGGDKVTRAVYKNFISLSYFKNKNYQQSIEAAYKAQDDIDNVLRSGGRQSYASRLENYGDKLKGLVLASKIMDGEIIINENNAVDFCSKYKNNHLVGPLISGENHWNTNYLDIVEALKKWSGFDKMMKMIDKGSKSIRGQRWQEVRDNLKLNGYSKEQIDIIIKNKQKINNLK